MNKVYTIVYSPGIFNDIQKAIDFYNQQTRATELGIRFLENLEKSFEKLEKSPFHYQIRYRNVRLLPIQSFPFKAHYWVDEE